MDLGGMNNLGKNFGDSKVVSGSKEFLMSNTIIAKIAFLLLIVIGFFIIFRLSTQAILWYYTPNPNPFLVTCRRDGSSSKIIPGDPSIKNSIPIIRSKNEREGLEFTWSIWLMIDKVHGINSAVSTATAKEKYYHIFNKGSNVGNSGGLFLNNPDAAPGLYLKAYVDKNDGDKVKNSLVSVMNTMKGNLNNKKMESETVIENVPIKKWIHIALRVEHKNFDTYVNGILHTRKILNSLPRQNYGDVNIAQQTFCTDDLQTNMAKEKETRNCGNSYGFDGEISSLRYFNSALNPVEIGNIVKVGPNMCTDGEAAIYPKYLSMNWYD